MDKEMTYYWKSNINGYMVIARSYVTEQGIIFDEGRIFDSKNPINGLNDFFIERHYVCKELKELKAKVTNLKKRYPEIIETKEIYR